LLGKTRIYAAIQQAKSERAKTTEITADEVIAELAKIGFANMADYMRHSKTAIRILIFRN
jgi:phage terminase small subunit